MSRHNIIGSERSGKHVVIRYVPARRRPAFWWARTILEAVICFGFVAVFWMGLTIR